MTVFELIRELALCEPNAEVRIVVTDKKCAGATPTVGLGSRSVHCGFDHDAGKVLLCTDKEICKTI
jgi:hypothetical protein